MTVPMSMRLESNGSSSTISVAVKIGSHIREQFGNIQLEKKKKTKIFSTDKNKL